MSKLFIQIFAIALVTFQSCNHSNLQSHCSDFKTGIFHYNVNGIAHSISRTDSIQIENDLTTGSIVKAKIKWINECEYELNYFDDKSYSKDTILGYVKTHTLTTKILKTKAGEINGTRYNYCVFESSMPGVAQKLIDTLWKHDASD